MCVCVRVYVCVCVCVCVCVSVCKVTILKSTLPSLGLVQAILREEDYTRVPDSLQLRKKQLSQCQREMSLIVGEACLHLSSLESPPPPRDSAWQR